MQALGANSRAVKHSERRFRCMREEFPDIVRDLRDARGEAKIAIWSSGNMTGIRQLMIDPA